MMKVLKKAVLVGLLTIVLLNSGPHAFAADRERNWSAGILLGAASLNQSLGTNFAGGAMIRTRIMPEFGVGLTVLAAVLDNYSSNNASYNVTLSHINFDFDYYVGNFWIGPRVGWAAINFSAQSGSTSINLSSESVFDWGPAAGYDLQLSSLISLGIDVSYMISAFSSQSINSLQYLATLKFHW